MPQPATSENPGYLQEQIITYLGNKRHLLPFIGQGVTAVQQHLGKNKLRCLDAFSGSGIVSRFLKQHAECLYTNDLEDYARIINTCYLANSDTVAAAHLPQVLQEVQQLILQEWAPGLISRLYAPADAAAIAPGERAFYTRRNAIYLDTARRIIDTLPAETQPFLLAPLLYEASVHTNTSGVFKGFYKNEHGIGQFGGRGKNALTRIMGDIELHLPVFSRFDCEHHILQGDAAAIAATLPELDLAYIDPPYNQHPYGSNYFMLNVLLNNKEPETISRVSGIPKDWNRSAYNKKAAAAAELTRLLQAIPARYLLISYNSEGHISLPDMQELLRPLGKFSMLQQDYATFRGCRNLRNRNLKVKEYLFLLQRQ